MSGPVIAELIAALVKIALVVGFIMLVVPFLVWGERKYIADVQARIGPNRVGPFGLLQSLADGIKLLFKEDLMPREVDRLLYLAAPVLMMLPALAVAAVIPFGDRVTVFGYETRLVIADLPVGILYVLAVTALGVYGIVIAGWASNNKYSLLGGLRSSAQMISYELPLGFSVVAALLISSAKGGNLSLVSIVEAQSGGILNWNFLWGFGLGMLAFLIFWVCGIAETNRAPFDLPEAETEIVAGYHTEYGGMKWSMFFLGEYAAMLNVGALATTLFLGGWQSPVAVEVIPAGAGGALGALKALGPVFWFLAKVTFFILVYYHLRATLPRLRYDRLMDFAWKKLLPVTFANIFVIAAVITFTQTDWRATGAEPTPAPATAPAGPGLPPGLVEPPPGEPPPTPEQPEPGDPPGEGEG